MNNSTMKPPDNGTSRLGAFVLTALVILVASLFLIGRNQHLIGAHLTLRARFNNVAGLRVGNNVRYSGIEVGTVRTLRILNDTTVEVDLSVKGEMSEVIRRNAVASLGADGLMGNKVVNIVPGNGAAVLVQDGDLLPSRGSVEIEDVLRTLSSSSSNIQVITEGLRTTVDRINDSKGLWDILQNPALGNDIRKATSDLAAATGHARQLTAGIRNLVEDVRQGKGTVGTLLRDTALSGDLHQTVQHILSVASHAEALATGLETLSQQIQNDYSLQKGVLPSALKDTSLTGHISRSLRNIESGTLRFNDNMEALQHNFLFRGYFKKKSTNNTRNRP